MMHAFKGLGRMTGAFVLVSALAVVPNAQAQTTAAYVYVQSQGPSGPVYGYNSSSTGQLSAISGSPFKPGTQIVGSNGSQFFTLGHTLIHSWAVGSNGAIGAQLSDVAFMNYGGGSCAGTANGDATAVLDHTGKYIYVVLQSGDSNPGGDTCEAIQSYIINSGGSFSFDGDTEQSSLSGGYTGIPSILGNESYAYADNGIEHQGAASSQDLLPLRRETSGTLQITSANEAVPSPGYYLYHPDADPTGAYVVVQLYPSNGQPPDDNTNPQLGSFSVDSSGNLSTTNTSSNMPTSALINAGSTFSPDGKMFVLYADNGVGNAASGIEIYNFNGAAPLTLFQKVLTGNAIDQVAWDTSGHLYAISKAQNHMYVFNVSSTGITVDPSVAISAPVSLVVTSQTSSGGGSCPTPTSPGVIVCSPSPGSTVSSPVQVTATANVSGGVYRFELWNGSTKLLTVRDSGTMDQTVSLAPGNYTLTFVAYNTTGTHEYNTRSITVK